MTRLPCACGGTVEAESERHREITRAVAEHARSEQHQRWREAGAFDAPAIEPYERRLCACRSVA